ncbi:hypothetical protein LY28_00698 [Ruminiclostridium sufflavum DSM 19573]|uniref:Peptidase S24/S26A/S26B/S26C domain-containing protein n=1 Tax=Ruminiclostridium sufflavum DSM 19573 TaxID=1121337 RepID=A0A318Y1Z4_9FIRM|nr:S24/S26 family peptidase [Ruminiclostridium sufflavum]PYG89479.1 hypothetical protein LY28_00698 [Ruminiclostridium sufflavum DSM 19573]
MCEVKKIKAAEMFPAVKEILGDGGRVWITVTGMSMYPFLREDEDCVELSPARIDTIKRGDIVLIQRVTGEYILHRVLRKEKDCFYIIGDAQRRIEGPLRAGQLIAAVTAVKRSNCRFACRNKLWKLLVAVWMNIIPLRRVIIKGLRFAARIRRAVVKPA